MSLSSAVIATVADPLRFNAALLFEDPMTLRERVVPEDV
jgi:hypothetical protein